MDLTPEQIHELNSVVAGAGGATSPGKAPEIDVLTQGAILRAHNERQAARDTLDSRTADPAWGKKLIDKDPATTAEFERLTAAIAADDPPVTIEGLAAGSSSRQFNAAVDAFAAGANLPPAVIAQVKNGDAVSPDEHQAAQAWLDRHMRDREWCKSLTDGNVEAAREMALVSVILSSEIDPNKTSKKVA